MKEKVEGVNSIVKKRYAEKKFGKNKYEAASVAKMLGQFGMVADHAFIYSCPAKLARPDAIAENLNSFLHALEVYPDRKS